MRYKYVIWQIKKILDTKYAFRSWEIAKDVFNLKDYRYIYSGEIESDDPLEDLFFKFNMDHPNDYRGHSLSVSDVVLLGNEETGSSNWYYCNSMGWKDLTKIVSPEPRIERDGERVYYIDTNGDRYIIYLMVDFNAKVVDISKPVHYMAAVVNEHPDEGSVRGWFYVEGESDEELLDCCKRYVN